MLYYPLFLFFITFLSIFIGPAITVLVMIMVYLYIASIIDNMELFS